MAKALLFDAFRNDKVDLIKLNGEVYGDIKASVRDDLIIIDDTSLLIEEGDTLRRVLPNGLQENYIVIDPGYSAGNDIISPRYKVEVEKETKIKKPVVEQVVYHASGPNSRINIGSTDASINVFSESITENNVFEKLRETIEQQVTGEDKELLLSSVDQLEQTKGTSKYNSTYKSFMQTAKDWTQILTPYLTVLMAYING